MDTEQDCKMDPYEFSVLACDAMHWVGDAEELDQHLQALICIDKGLKWIADHGRLDTSDVRKRVDLHLLALTTASKHIQNGGKPPEQTIQGWLVQAKG